MFKQISWQNYWMGIAVLSALYYVVIYFLYFRNRFSIRFLKGITANKAVKNTGNENTAENEITVFDSCVTDLGAFFEKAGDRKWIKEELVFALRKILQKYPSLKNSSYEDTIQRVVMLQGDHVCSVHLHEEDLNQLWTGL